MRCALFVTVLLLLTLGVAPGHAEKRVALVVGNERYANLSANDQLQKAVNDARAVASALQQIGFDVISGENLDRRALLGKLSELTQRIAPGDMAFFFFSGHGVAIDGVNYILAADVPNITTGQETLLKNEALGEQSIIAELTGRGVRVAVVVLDACRSNPFGRSGGKGIGGQKGLAPPPEVRGVFSLYAASNGQAARDRLSDDDPSTNSVFSRVLVPALTRPGLDLTALAFDVREEVARVARTAGYVQEPAYYDGTIGGRVYLAGTPPPPISLGGPDAAQAWSVVQNTTSLAVLDEFLRQFGNSPFYGSLARVRRDELVKEQAKQQTAAVAPQAKPSVPPAVTYSPAPPAPVPPAPPAAVALQTPGVPGALPSTRPGAVAEISGAGATFPYPVYAKWADTYKKATGVGLNYQSIGSGGGIKQIQAKTVVFGATDAPLSGDDLNKNGLVQFPTVMGGIVPVVNVDGITPGSLVLDGPTLARIFLGQVKSWDDAAIKALNPGMTLPKLAIAVVHRSDGSGTTLNFTNYLSKVSPEWKTKVGEATSVEWPLGLGVKGNEGVANNMALTRGSIGYVEYAYAKQYKLTFIRMINADGKTVSPVPETFQAAAANADWNSVPGYGVILSNQPGARSWPMAVATFILIHKQPQDPAAAGEALKFFAWAYANGGKAAEELDYVPMPASAVSAIEGMWAREIKDARGKPIFVAAH